MSDSYDDKAAQVQRTSRAIAAFGRQCAADALSSGRRVIEAANKYKSEMTTIPRDLTMCRMRREELFAALSAPRVGD